MIYVDLCGSIEGQILMHINKNNMAMSSSYAISGNSRNFRYLIGCKETFSTLLNRVNESYVALLLVCHYQGGSGVQLAMVLEKIINLI
jgi:hypothetical protein